MAVEVPVELQARLQAVGQEQVFLGWASLSDAERTALLAQLAALDLPGLAQLFALRDQQEILPERTTIQPLPVTLPSELTPAHTAAGRAALDRGEVAVLIVAGGQGSRLGFEKPKGMYPIGPVSHKSLFQIHAEKVLALSRRHDRTVPLLVMTSPATHAETVAFFHDHGYFGLPATDVMFFQQGSLPTLDLHTGKLLLEKPGTLFLSPNGHGGTLTALGELGLLDQLRRQGIRHLFYFQVDNPLVRVADPAFVGLHLLTRAEVSSRVIDKETPDEKMGVFACIAGKCGIIEYSDLPADLAHLRNADGKLTYRAANPAIHLFDLDFLTRVTSGANRLPFHVARKKVPCLDAMGKLCTPTTENALKFEMFIFDALPKAERWAALATTRAGEFVPLKNATGPDSPDAVRLALSDLATAWLRHAGVLVPADAGPLEISPLFALDETAVAHRANEFLVRGGPQYWGEVPSSC
jgi:UDP-N-acetylglucosamine/UDP-N-acetylgalactosamine diphosphorylase